MPRRSGVFAVEWVSIHYFKTPTL